MLIVMLLRHGQMTILLVLLQAIMMYQTLLVVFKEENTLILLILIFRLLFQKVLIDYNLFQFLLTLVEKIFLNLVRRVHSLKLQLTHMRLLALSRLSLPVVI